MKRNDRTVGLLTVVITLAFAGACGEESAPVEPPSESAPLEAAPPTNVPEEVVEAPTPPPPPSPITVAMREERYDDVCTELRRQAFSSHVCAFIAARARGERGSLNQRHLRRFLRNHRVRRLRGRIVDVFDSSGGGLLTLYDARVGGRTVTLGTTDTQFTTTGSFSVWAQRRVRDVGGAPAYLEFKPAADIMDLARERHADDYQLMARRLLGDLVVRWEGWRHQEAEVEPEPTPAGDEGSGATEERRRECRRFCFEYRDCMRDMGSHAACEVNINRRCRACREEGAHR